MVRKIIIAMGCVIALTGCELELDTETEYVEVYVEKADEIAPTLLASTPENEQTDVEAKTNIQLFFNEPLSQKIPNSSIQILDQASNEFIPAALDIKGSTIIITPSEKLKYETIYIIESDYEISDIADNYISTPINIEFTTQIAPVIEVDRPADEEIVSGLVSISGTANPEVKQVLVKVGDSGFIEATGTNEWSLVIDSTEMVEGLTSIEVKGNNGYWDVALKNINVTVSNVDPLVGLWEKQSGTGCTVGRNIQFFESGVYDESDCVLFASYSNSWQRQSENQISIFRQTAAPAIVTVTLTEDGNTLTLVSSSHNITLVRQ